MAYQKTQLIESLICTMSAAIKSFLKTALSWNLLSSRPSLEFTIDGISIKVWSAIYKEFKTFSSTLERWKIEENESWNYRNSCQISRTISQEWKHLSYKMCSWWRLKFLCQKATVLLSFVSSNLLTNLILAWCEFIRHYRRYLHTESIPA